MNELATLADLILAAHAEGDGELASWLAGQAGNPEALAQLTAAERQESLEGHAPEGRWLLEHGFTGTITDTAGRKRQYADGKPVAMQHDKPSTGARTDQHHPEDLAGADKLAAAIPPAEKGRIGKLKEAVRGKLEKSAGGRAVLALGDAGHWLFHHVERRALFVAKKVQELGAAAARERGLSPEATEKLKRALYWADFGGGYITGGLATATGMPLPVVKAAMFLPSASVAYLAYSTARNPLATWKAAKAVVKATFARGGGAKHESEEDALHVGPELAAAIADRIDRSDVDSEWWVACFHAALAETQGDVRRALELADAAAESQPGPEE